MDTTLTDALLGRLLDGRYRVVSRLARGGMASVYTATDIRLDRDVAVKVMHPALADDPEFVARFIREARAAARLSHPNVVAVFDQGADDGAVFLVMEHVDGTTLRELLRERGRLSVPEAVAVLYPVLAALAAAHAAGLVHRDVKPENVLLAADGRVKVADFGLARAVTGSHLTATGGLLIGTVSYLAPEQVERGVADARADVYAAGVLLYELVTGQVPFVGETPLAIAYRHVHETVPPPSSRVAVPAEIDRLVALACARDPADRPADAGALLRELDLVCAGLGITNPAEHLPVPAAAEIPTTVLRSPGGSTLVVGPRAAGAAPPGQRRRRRWPLIALVVVLLATIAGVGGWWLAAGRYAPAPGLLTLTLSEARVAASKAGFSVHTGSPVYSDTVPHGDVAAQSPAPQARVRRHSVIVVRLSLGVLTHAVPNVRGDTLAAARTALAAASFPIAGTAQVFDDQVAPGDVVRTDPPPGQVVRHSTPVTVYLSKGPAPVVVPDVQGQPLGQARATLTAAGFTVTTTAAYDVQVPKGDVSAQAPGAGTSAPHGSVVHLTVSKGPPLVPVPNVVGDSVPQAQSILVGAGFQVVVVDFYGSGFVVQEDPSAGSQEPRGTTVRVLE